MKKGKLGIAGFGNEENQGEGSRKMTEVSRLAKAKCLKVGSACLPGRNQMATKTIY